MSRIKTGVVGVGHLGRHHLRWLSQLPDSDLIGLFDTDRDKAERYAKEYNVKAFNSLKEMAAEVEAVTIVVPTTEHFKTAAFFIENKIACLIEKPVTATIDEAKELSRLATENKTVVTVGHIERFNPAVRALEAHEVSPAFIEGHRLASFDPRGTDVAVVLDLMIHDIDLALNFVGSEVVDIQASAVAVISEQVDIANARLSFANGTVANLTASRISLQSMRKMRMFQKSRYYSLDLAAKQADVYRLAVPGDNAEGMRVPLGKSGRDILYKKHVDDGKDMLGAELAAFLSSAKGECPVVVTIDEAASALRIALEIEKIGRASVTQAISKKPD